MNAADRNRTGTVSLQQDFKSCASASSATPAYHDFSWKWDLQGSNLWPSACKADALPAELRSHALLVVSVKWNSSDSWHARMAKTQMNFIYPSVSAGWRFLIVIHSRIKTHYKRPRRDSNPWPPPWQGGALTNWATRPYKGLYLQNFIQFRFVFLRY